jgi:drug/metabolite transporter (DMT)-like permease
MISKENKSLGWLLLISLSVIWGSSFILMHEGLKYFTPTQLASFRLSLVGLLFLPFGMHGIRFVEKKDIKWFALAGLLGNFIPAYCFAIAITHIQSSTAGALNSLTPFFTLISGILLFSKKFNKYKSIGIAIGMIGALILIILKPGGGAETNYLYGLLIIAATLLYGINVNIIETKLSKYDPVKISTIPLSLIFFPAVLCLIYFNFPLTEMLNPVYIKGTMYISTLGLIGTGLGLILFNRLIQISTGLFASTVTYMMPVVSSFWGVYNNEPIGPIQILSFCLILLGVLLVRKIK